MGKGIFNIDEKKNKDKRKEIILKILKIVFIIATLPVYLFFKIIFSKKLSRNSKAWLGPIVGFLAFMYTLSIYFGIKYPDDKSPDRSVPEEPVSVSTTIATTVSTTSTTKSTTTRLTTTAATTTPTTTELTTTAPETEIITESETIPETVPETPAPVVPRETEPKTYWLNTDSGKYHYASCRTIKDGTTESYWQSTTDIEWLRNNYDACKVCHPR